MIGRVVTRLMQSALVIARLAESAPARFGQLHMCSEYVARIRDAEPVVGPSPAKKVSTLHHDFAVGVGNQFGSSRRGPKGQLHLGDPHARREIERTLTRTAMNPVNRPGLRRIGYSDRRSHLVPP